MLSKTEALLMFSTIPLAEINFLINCYLVFSAFKKKHLLLSATLFFQLFLVSGQAIQIQGDLEVTSKLTYLNHEISTDGFYWAQIYYFLALIGQGLLLVNVKRVRETKAIKEHMSASISKLSYLSLIVFIAISAFALVFLVAGIESVLNDSRPGVASGTTIFLVFISFGLMPSLEKISRKQSILFIDIVLAMFSLVVTLLFSRLHIILYSLIFMFCIYYSREFHLRKKSQVDIPMLVFPLLAGIVFFGFGAYRDALNHVQGSFLDVIEYIYNNPDAGVLTLKYNYVAGIEGMSSLSGAFTLALNVPEHLFPSDFGLSFVLMSFIQVIPGFLKEIFQPVASYLREIYWYSSSIVSPGIEVSFVSFGILGVLVYPFVFILSCTKILKIYLSATSTFGILYSLFLSGLQVFMVRGSWHVWLAHIIAYAIGIRIYMLIAGKNHSRNQPKLR